MAGWFGALDLVLLATMAWMMRRALAPVRRLEQEIAAVEKRQRSQLGEGYPRELAGVTSGLNALLESERNRIARYRDTLGNLAHSLKTPLAVIRASLGSADSDQRRSAAAIQLEIDRIAQIVEHQLKRAAAGGGATLGQAPVPVLALLTDLRAALLKVHASKDLQHRDRCAGGAGLSRRQRRYPRAAGQCGGQRLQMVPLARAGECALRSGSQRAAAPVDRGGGRWPGHSAGTAHARDRARRARR